MELLPLWEEFCRHRDEAKLADDELTKTLNDQHQQQRRRCSVTRPQAKDKRPPYRKVIRTLMLTVITVIYDLDHDGHS